MRVAGIILLLVSAIVAVAAFFFDTSVASYADMGNSAAPVLRETTDLALLQRQMMVFHLGLAGLVAGTLLYVGSELAGRSAGERVEDARPAAVAPLPTSGPRRGFTGRELTIAAVLVAATILILLAVAMFGRGGEPQVANGVVPIDEVNLSDDSYADEAALLNETRHRRAAAERKAREDAAANAAAPAPAAQTPAPASAQPVETPAANSATAPETPPPAPSQPPGNQL
jgi:hypothetical protein